ncbi:MAG TPA: extracellular solute-binding protein [Aggregatilineales bacterium]|nr:extracellular solute-binding protein [Aggregatilineales bacterium]
MLRNKRVLSLLMTVGMTLGLLPLNRLQAQSNSTILLSVAAPTFLADSISARVIADFESQHAGVSIQVVPESPSIPSAAQGLTASLDAVAKYVSTADVLYVDPNRISAEATRAGYFLDLAPFVSDDKALNVDDFYPSIWSAFQWDKGVWALPMSTDVITLTYKPSAFDKAGIAYPSTTWTITDFDDAIRKLAVKDPDGRVTTPGLAATPTSLALLFRVLVSDGFYDPNTVPNPPQFSKGHIEDILGVWGKLNSEGLVSTAGGFANPDIPMAIGNAYGVLFAGAITNNTEKSVGVLLPGGKAGLNVQGYAVSAGAEHPDLAYALANFLTTQAEVAGRVSASPARKSLVGADNGTGFTLKVPPEVQKLFQDGIANGIGLSEMRFADYFVIALNEVAANTDPKTAVNDAEAQAIQNAQAASDMKASVKVTITEPQPEASSVDGKAVLKFGVQSFANPLPQQDKWDALIKDFAASDSQVGVINLTPIRQGQDTNSGKFDCFYLSTNDVPTAQLDKLLPLDPFLSADSTFDQNDIVGNTMHQVMRDNKVWAMPIVITPTILKYDPNKFDKAGLAAPSNGWTIDKFNDALKALHVDPKDTPPFIPSNTGGSYLFLLIAAYGGLPLDYRVDPVAIDFTSDANKAAIKQVLDLAKNNYIKYTPLGSLRFDFGPPADDATPTILNTTLNGLNFRVMFTAGGPSSDASSDPTKDFKPVTYPRGNQFSGVSYDIGTGYIYSGTKYPEACYRWLSTLARHPELFNAMPARRSLLTDPIVSAASGADLTSLYNQIDDVLQDRNTVAFPSLFSGGSNPTTFIYQYWLFQAFDNYVVRDGNLDSDLKDAEDKSKSMQSCTQSLPPIDYSSQDTMRQYVKAFGKCASRVDPTLGAIFSLIGG